MIDAEPKIQEVKEFTVAGVSVRTINDDEFNPQKAKLPKLWDNFLGSGLAEKIPNRLPETPVFGVYSNYDSDATGFYTVTAGVNIIPESNNENWDTLIIQSGTYLVFEAIGIIPQIVINTWNQIWLYFENNPKYRRNFISDFEMYLGTEEIAIYIGVVP
jgi:predicted transcriptional regulator YdeE